MHFPTTSPRRVIGAAAIACAAALVPVAALAATSAPASRPASTPACATSGLVIWFAPQAGGGYAGGYYYNINFTNLSGHACTLRGYPGVSAVSLTGHQIGSPAGRGANLGTKVRTIRLAEGATARAQLNVGDPGKWSQCSPFPTAAGLRVYPPGQFSSKVVPYPLGACGHTGVAWMGAGPVQNS